MIPRNKVILALFIGGIGITVAMSMLWIDSASAARGNRDLFKSWKSLIDPLVNLQGRVDELEEEVEFLGAKVEDLQDQIEEITSPRDDIVFLVDEFEYSPGDDVGVKGLIDEDIFDPDLEEIFITLTFPEGETDIFGTDNESEFEFAIPLVDDAVDGLYTLRLQYGESAKYSYFIVDENENLAEIEVEDVFGSGDNVDIEGTIFDTALGENEVEITVLDSNNESVVAEEVELDAGDNFDFDFDLDDEAPLGRYAILIEYDGAFVDEALFEVHK